MSTVTCPQCGEENRRAARFCKRCQADLSPTRGIAPAMPDQAAPPPSEAGLLTGLVRAVQRRVMGTESASPPRRAGWLSERSIEPKQRTDFPVVDCPFRTKP